ncbi:MAG: polymer-forming cytoskeletal protein [Lachnospiraceae bacterium]|nr:polymer-forming cytoskeletal protein [Lachnospiraceae bacterium]
MGLFSDAKNGELDKKKDETAIAEDDIFAVSDDEAAIDAADIDADLLESILEETQEAPVEEEVVVKTQPAVNVPDVADRKKREVSEEEKSSVTVITKGTTINGSIISDCSLDVMGTINGDIECLGKLTISGKVSGNSRASEVFINTERLEGSVTSEGCVKIGLGTVVIGDINASSAVFAGAVKGEIDVNGPVVLDSTAIIKGNIKAKSVQMNNGAILDGFCSLTYSDLDVDSIFE